MRSCRVLAGLLVVLAGCGGTLEDNSLDARSSPDDGSPAADGDSCSGGTVPCDGECVDLDTDQEHCGECGVSCSGPAVCTGGECVVSLSGTLSGLISYPDAVVSIDGAVTVTAWNGSDSVDSCEVGETGCLALEGRKIVVAAGVTIDATGKGYGGFGGAGGGAVTANSTDGPIAGGSGGAGGYAAAASNGDTTTDHSLRMGSGGGGGSGGASAYEPSYSSVGGSGGGGAGSPGGGCVSLVASERIEIAGAIVTRGGGLGGNGGSGTDGAFGGYTCDLEGSGGGGGDAAASGSGGGGSGVNGYFASGYNSCIDRQCEDGGSHAVSGGSGGAGGAGAGGGVLLEAPAVSIGGTIDARGAVGAGNGGTVKIFYQGTAPSQTGIQAGRIYSHAY